MKLFAAIILAAILSGCKPTESDKRLAAAPQYASRPTEMYYIHASGSKFLTKTYSLDKGNEYNPPQVTFVDEESGQPGIAYGAFVIIKAK